ncbi:MAG: response regulator [Bacteroidales bacterium]|nr:response regulator [Bacteroidales bacterium]
MEEQIVGLYFLLVGVIGLFSAGYMLLLPVEWQVSLILFSLGAILLLFFVLIKKGIIVQKKFYIPALGNQLILVAIFLISGGSSGAAMYYCIPYLLIIALLPPRHYKLLLILFLSVLVGLLYVEKSFDVVLISYANENERFYNYLFTIFIVSLVCSLLIKKIINNYQGAKEKSELQNIELSSQKNQIQELMLRETQLNQQKLDFFTNISHEFRTPLSLISAPVEKLIKAEEDESKVQTLNMISQNVKMLEKLVNQILEFRKLDSGALSLDRKPIDIIAYLKKHTYKHQPLAELRKIQLIFKTNLASQIIKLDVQKTERIFNNILSNSFNNTSEGGEIKIEVSEFNRNVKESYKDKNQDKSYLKICISDTGKGISKEHLENVFNPFYQAPDTTYGAGLGLSMANELVKLHHGYMDMDSSPEKGTSTSIYLPVEVIGEQEVVVEVDTVEIMGIYEGEQDDFSYLPLVNAKNNIDEDFNVNTLPKVLILEDNKYIIHLLTEELSQDYHMISAFDGKEGLSLAQREMPDLIISDIMMPEMEGTDVCKLLKEDIRTSHIPIILLTAKVGEDHKIKGLSLGADDYIYKPFNIEEVKARVTNLLKGRKELRERFKLEFQNGSVIDNVPEQTPDEKFLNKAINLVVSNIDNCEFGVGELVTEIGVSRSVVHNKIKSLTNQTTSEFIASIRMKKAAILLAEKNRSIAEIADMTGYTDPTYFGKTFKKLYGKTPKQFQMGN